MSTKPCKTPTKQCKTSTKPCKTPTERSLVTARRRCTLRTMNSSLYSRSIPTKPTKSSTRRYATASCQRVYTSKRTSIFVLVRRSWWHAKATIPTFRLCTVVFASMGMLPGRHMDRGFQSTSYNFEVAVMTGSDVVLIIVGTKTKPAFIDKFFKYEESEYLILSFASLASTLEERSTTVSMKHPRKSTCKSPSVSLWKIDLFCCPCCFEKTYLYDRAIV